MGEKRLYSVTEVAEMTGRAGITIRRIAKRYTDSGMPIGQLIGNSWVFDEDDIRMIRSLDRRGGRGHGLIDQSENAKWIKSKQKKPASTNKKEKPVSTGAKWNNLKKGRNPNGQTNV